MRRFVQVDVFGTRPLSGNPLAVVLDADGLTDAEMSAFAHWTQLSETTFLLPPTDPAADYRVRIFTASGELPFAGHPTLGSAHAWLAAGGVPRRPGLLVQECGAGLVQVRDADGALWFRAPALRRSGPLDEATLTEALDCLGIGRDAVVDHAWGDNGPPWAMLHLSDAAAVRALRPDSGRLDSFYVGVIGFSEPGSDHLYEVRAFTPPPPAEDPVTGSLNAAVAAWQRAKGAAPASYVVKQGMQAGFEGTINVLDDDGGLWIGGATTTIIEGATSW